MQRVRRLSFGGAIAAAAERRDAPAQACIAVLTRRHVLLVPRGARCTATAGYDATARRFGKDSTSLL